MAGAEGPFRSTVEYRVRRVGPWPRSAGITAGRLGFRRTLAPVAPPPCPRDSRPARTALSRDTALSARAAAWLARPSSVARGRAGAGHAGSAVRLRRRAPAPTPPPPRDPPHSRRPRGTPAAGPGPATPTGEPAEFSRNPHRENSQFSRNLTVSWITGALGCGGDDLLPPAARVEPADGCPRHARGAPGRNAAGAAVRPVLRGRGGRASPNGCTMPWSRTTWATASSPT
jgi:hypothetical protein